MIRFLLDREEVVLGEAWAGVTVLEFLREGRGRFGTKEGCASGDCGACTVVVGEVVDGDDGGEGADSGMVYRAVNGCITFVGALHGRRLITVEDLAGGDVDGAGGRVVGGDDADGGGVGGRVVGGVGGLHPVQRAMVEWHGSQCGFCTPGFVMSLFALYQSRRRVSRRVVEEFLGGNLCRCTGYRPIVDAALQVVGGAAADRFSRDAGVCGRRLRALRRLPVAVAGFYVPRSVRQLTAVLRRVPGARLLGGGTDLALEVTQSLRVLEEIVFVGRVAELLRVRVAADGIEIGAAVSVAACRRVICAEYPQLEELFRRFGSAQIRNQATLGGNIANASPVADLPPALIALGARVVLQCGARTRRLAVEDFFLDYKQTALAPGEFIRSVLLPRAGGGRVFAYKISKRIDDDIAAVCAVFVLTLRGGVVSAVRTGFGGMAATPKRACHLERALHGRALDAAAIAAAGPALRRDFTPISDARAGANYRITVAHNLLRRLRLEIDHPDLPASVTAD